MSANVTKARLCAEAARAAGMPSRPAKRLVDAFLAALKAALKEGKRVELRGLGSFAPCEWHGRKVRPIGDRKAKRIPASLFIRFKAAAPLRRMRPDAT